MKILDKARDKLTVTKATRETVKSTLIFTLKTLETILDGIPVVGDTPRAVITTAIQFVDQVKVSPVPFSPRDAHS